MRTLFCQPLFAYFKLTSFPFIFVVMCLWLLDSRDRTEWIERLKMASTFVLIIFLLFVVYIHDGMEFLMGLISQEAAAKPEGFSLGRILPPYVLKILPLASGRGRLLLVALAARAEIL